MDIIMDDGLTRMWTVNGRRREEICLVVWEKLKNPSVYSTTTDKNGRLKAIEFDFFDGNNDETRVNIPLSKLVLNESVKWLILKYERK